MRRWVPVLALVTVAALAAACGGGDDKAAAERQPIAVPVELAPPALKSGQYVTRMDDQAKEAFNKLDERALVDDGRLWQIRQVSDDRLIGTLQISTAARKVDLVEEQSRRSIVNHILPGSKQEIDVSGIAVWASESNDKLVYVWFARDLFQVLQLKGTGIEPEALLQEIITHQTASPAWKGLPTPSADEELIEGEA